MKYYINGRSQERLTGSQLIAGIIAYFMIEAGLIWMVISWI